MKFGKQFDFYKIPEWAEYYFDYRTLKKLIKYLDKRRNKKNKASKKLEQLGVNEHSDSTDDERGSSKDDESYFIENTIDNVEHSIVPVQRKVKLSRYSETQQIEYFIDMFKRKMNIVEQFYNAKLAELNKSLRNLKRKFKEKKKEVKDRNTDSIRLVRKLENAERDELGYAVSYKRAISNLYNQTSWLHSFHSINSIAKEKLKKKANKFFKMNNMTLIKAELEKAEKEYKWCSKSQPQEVVLLRRKIKEAYEDEFTFGDKNKARNELEERMTGIGQVKHVRLIAFYAGVIVAALFFLFTINYVTNINKTEEEIRQQSLVPFFPAFNFTFVLIEMFIGVGVNIIILRRYRINYIYIFEIDPKLRLGAYEMFQNSLLLLAVWMIALVVTKLTLCFDLFSGNFVIFSLGINMAIISFLFFPFQVFYYDFRKGILHTMVKNFIPLGKNGVRFSDFLFGDILTSLNKPFASMILSFCLLSCQNCRKENDRSSDCNRNTYPCLIVLLLPFVIRFFQCINRYYYTKEAWPNLWNTFKYVGGFSNTFFSWYYATHKQYDTEGNEVLGKEFVLFIVVGLLSQSYMLFWDVYVDWNLGRLKSKNFFLRDNIVYPHWMYYFAIITDAIMRFAWLWTMKLLNPNYDEWNNLGLAIVEAYRRIQWCVFRIENENTNNPEKYRTILEIPELPLD